MNNKAKKGVESKQAMGVLYSNKGYSNKELPFPFFAYRNLPSSQDFVSETLKHRVGEWEVWSPIPVSIRQMSVRTQPKAKQRLWANQFSPSYSRYLSYLQLLEMHQALLPTFKREIVNLLHG